MKKILLLCFLSLQIHAGDRPCLEDAKKLCPNANGNKKEIMKCLKEHQSELSPECQERAGKAKERVKELKENCADDVKKFCADIKPGNGAVLRCLKSHEDKISEKCKGTLR